MGKKLTNKKTMRAFDCFAAVLLRGRKVFSMFFKISP